MTQRPDTFSPLALLLAVAGAGLPTQAVEVPQGQVETQPAAPVLSQPKPLTGMNLDFTQGAKLGEVLQNLSHHSGVTIILHASASAHALTTNADLRGMDFQRALDTLVLQNDLFYKVMDPTSIMVFKKTPQNLHEFETKSIKTFYLGNAEVEVVRQTLDSLMPQLRVFTDKRLSSVTVSGTPADLAATQKIVNNLDLAKAEVRVQMEILEVSRQASVAAGVLPLAGSSAGPDAKVLTSDQALAKVRQDPNSKLLFSPDIRILSGEIAELKVGRKLSSAQALPGAKTPRNAAAGKPEDPKPAPPSADLGMMIKLKPRVHPDHEITLELDYRSSDPVKAGEPGRAGLSERVIKTTLRLKEGEAVVLGGLLEDEPRNGAAEGRKDRLLVIKAVVVRRGDQ